jgi:hypothetical protein
MENRAATAKQPHAKQSGNKKEKQKVKVRLPKTKKCGAASLQQVRRIY